MCVFVCVCFFFLITPPPSTFPVSPSQIPFQSNSWGPPWSSSFPPLPSFSPSTPPSCYHLRLETSPEPFIPLLAISLSTLSHHPAVPPIAPSIVSLQLPTPRHPLPFGVTPCVKCISPGEIYFLQDAPQRAKDARWPAQLRVALFFPYSYSVFDLFDMLGGCDSMFRKWVGCEQSCEYSEVWSKQLDQQSACPCEERRRWVPVFTPRAQTAGGGRVFRNPAISWRLD